MPVIILVHEAIQNTESRVIGFSGASRPITPDATEAMDSPVLETAQKTRPGTPAEGLEVIESRDDCTREAVEPAVALGRGLDIDPRQSGRLMYAVIYKEAVAANLREKTVWFYLRSR